MTPNEIKIELLKNNKTVTQIAHSCTAKLGRTIFREQISMCIHKKREYPEIREVIAMELGTSVETLFGRSFSNSAF